MQPGGFKLEIKRKVKAPKQISKWEEMVLSLTLRRTAELRTAEFGGCLSRLGSFPA